MREKFLQNAFSLTEESEAEPCQAKCCLSGESISSGFPIQKILSSSMGDVADIVKINSGWIGCEAAACMKASKTLRGNLCALPSQGIFPFVAETSATEDRPTWSALLRGVPEGTPSLMVFTDESKRRLWPFAKISEYGEQWRPYLNTGASIPANISRECRLSRSLFLRCLNFVEETYSHGFSKYAIMEGLLDISSSKAIKAHGISYAMQQEEQLKQWRGWDELLLAVFVAQKHDIPTPPMIQEKQSWKTQLNLW